MRHGEAEGRGAEGDEARALTARGAAHCRRLAAHLRATGSGRGLEWELILCSSARRARASAELLAAAGSPPAPLEARQSLYLASAETLMAALRALPAGTGAVLLVGHNPGLQALTRRLAGDGERRAAREFPAGALAGFACDIESWADLTPRAVRLRHFLTPKDIAKPGAGAGEPPLVTKKTN